MLTDSHCHLHMLELDDIDGGLNKILQNAENNRVEYMVCVGTRLEDVPQILKIAHQYEGIHASVGLHPNELTDEEPTVDILVKLASDPKVVAIGETGLDYFRTEGQQPWQMERFRTHIQAAKITQKPVIIHTRAARQDTLAILREERVDEVGGVFHCFTEDWETAKAGLDLGLYISFSGIITFKNATDLQEVVKQVPIDRLLIETDCPYLAPVPHRGKMNQPAYVKFVAECIAMLREESFELIAEKTTGNYLRLFNI